MPFSGPQDPDLPDNVKRLSEKKRRQWVAVWNSAFKRCMGGDTRVRSPDTKKCESFAFQNANGVVLKAEMKFSVFQQTADIRMESHLGRMWIVAPMVMVKEGVLNGNLVLAEEFGRYVEAWNGIPVTLGHPMENGVHVSANSPKFDKELTIGRVYNAVMSGDGKSLKGEAWIDLEKVKMMGGDATTAVQRLEEGQLIDVSTSYFSDIEPGRGERFGQKFDAIIRNIRPDHLAVLLDEEGACSLDDGCGIPRNQKTREEEVFVEVEDVVKIVKTENAPILSVLSAVARKVLGKGVPMNKKELIAKITKVEANPLTAEALEVIEFEDLESMLEFLEGLEEEEPAKPTAQEQKEVEGLIEKLTAIEGNKFDAKALGAMNVDTLKTLLETLEAESEGDPDPDKNKGQESELDKALAKALAPIQKDLKELGESVKSIETNAEAEAEAEKAEHIEALKADKNNLFSEEDMKDMSVGSLEKLRRTLQPSSYIGVPFPRTRPDEDVIEDPEPIKFNTPEGREALGWRRQNGKGG